MMNKLFIILALSLFLFNCNNSKHEVAEEKEEVKEEIDTLVSDVNWSEEDEYVEEKPARESHSSGRGGGGGGAADNEEDVLKYQNYQRNGDSPSDFAKAVIYPAIRMVYSDNFAKPKARVQNSEMNGDRHSIEMTITWKDHWVPKFEISGTLEVNSDGSDAKFTITGKNDYAESLEFTEDNFKTQLNIASL